LLARPANHSEPATMAPSLRALRGHTADPLPHRRPGHEYGVAALATP